MSMKHRKITQCTLSVEAMIQFQWFMNINPCPGNGRGYFYPPVQFLPKIAN